MVYRLTENELRFLLVFSEISMLSPVEPTDPELLEDVNSILESLKAKEYIFSEKNEYYLPEELTFFMNVIRDPFAVFTIKSDYKKIWAFFKEDAIILLSKEENYEIMWIPYIHLLIGATASFMEPYLNTETSNEHIYEIGELDKVRDSLISDGYKKQYEVAVYRSQNTSSTVVYEVFSNTKCQYLVYTKEDKLIVNQPCKMDMVNSLTGITAYLHSDSMKQSID